MKKIITLVLLSFIAIACKNSISGTYQGEIPCADCEAISQKLTLNDDNTFVLEAIYKGSDNEEPIVDKGTYTVKGDVVTLSIEDAPSMYKVSGNTLEQLDINGKKIESELNYTLTKE